MKNKLAPILIVFLMILSGTSKGQTTYYHENPFERTFTKSEQPPTFGATSLELKKYLTEKLQEQIKSTNGKVQIGIYIDTTGKVLCGVIKNSSNLEVDKIKLNLIFDTMPYWNPAIQNGRKVQCMEQVFIEFNNQDLDVTYKMGIS